MADEATEYQRGYQDGFNTGRYGCRWDGEGPSSHLHQHASPSHEEGAWCNKCYCFEPLTAFRGGYDQRYLQDSGQRHPPTAISVDE